jgi:L-lactate dehydrogenase complex protein LldG
MRRIRTALGYAPDAARTAAGLFAENPSAEELEILDRIGKRTETERDALLEELVAAGKPINLAVIPAPDLAAAAAAIVSLVDEKAPEWGQSKSVAAWRHPLIDDLNLPERLSRLKVPVRTADPVDPAAGPAAAQAERNRQRNDLIAAFIGVTAADFCMADTATLVLRNRPGQPRSTALIPSIHIAVITRGQIIRDMKELFALLRWDERFRQEGLSNYMSFISGPSKTADIEATMVHGARGPREVHLIVIR